MKTIIFYSGKGGVGKTTVTGLMALELSRAGKSVVVLDADINTPSIPVLFPKDSYRNIKIFSTGYESSSLLYFSLGTAESLLSEFIKQIKAIKKDIDYLLIDTPPSVTSIHHKIFKKFEISSAVIITQPTKLSITDVKRTISLFHTNKVPISGLVYNMVDSSLSLGFGEMLGFKGMDVLAELPLSPELNAAIEDKAFNKFKSGFDLGAVVKAVSNSHDTAWKTFSTNKDLFKAYTIEDIEQMVAAARHSQSDLKKVLKFYNIETWDYIRDELSNNSVFPDRFLSENNTERIERLVNAFDESDTPLFLVTNAPNTEIPLYPGEVGTGALVMGSDSYYGVPRISYRTDAGAVILFPHEVMPTTAKYLLEAQTQSELIPYPNTDVQRYIPTYDIMLQIEYAYGSRVGLHPHWEQRYRDLGLVVEEEDVSNG